MADEKISVTFDFIIRDRERLMAVARKAYDQAPAKVAWPHNPDPEMRRLHQASFEEFTSDDAGSALLELLERMWSLHEDDNIAGVRYVGSTITREQAIGPRLVPPR